MSKRLTQLQSDRPLKERLYNFFEAVTSDMEERKIPGCLASNSLSQEVLTERDLKTYVFSGLDGFLGLLSRLVEDGVSRGDFRKGLDPAVTGKVLLTYLHGLHRLSRYNFDAGKQRTEVRAFLDSILL